MTAPPVPPDADLRNFRWVPIDRPRLFASTFYAQASHEELGVATILWLKSWDQVPAGSLPDDDRQLCHLADLGRDLKRWLQLKPMVMHGWDVYDDGRLYHNTVAEGVNAALERKEKQRNRTAAATAARRNVNRNVDVTDNVTLTLRSPKDQEKGKDLEGRSPTVGDRPGREPNGSLPLRARARERGPKSKSAREIQTEAFYHAALDSQRSRNC